jgi:hypothetical protein
MSMTHGYDMGKGGTLSIGCGLGVVTVGVCLVDTADGTGLLVDRNASFFPFLRLGFVKCLLG